MKAVLGIGTNIGDRMENILNVYNSLELLPDTKIISKSGIYETKPWGFTEQADFLNCVVMVETKLSAHALLGVCLGIEAAFGRIRKFKNGPRIIDIDILFYENEQYCENELTVPHPLISERDFVLVPLEDIFPDKKAFCFDFSEAYFKIDKTKIKPYK